MKTQQLKSDALATFKGIQKAYKVSVGVFEALAWAGLLATSYTIIYRNMKGEISLNDVLFVAVVFSAIAITLRLLVEGAKYFREIGRE